MGLLSLAVMTFFPGLTLTKAFASTLLHLLFGAMYVSKVFKSCCCMTQTMSISRLCMLFYRSIFCCQSELAEIHEIWNYVFKIISWMHWILQRWKQSIFDNIIIMSYQTTSKQRSIQAPLCAHIFRGSKLIIRNIKVKDYILLLGFYRLIYKLKFTMSMCIFWLIGLEPIMGSNRLSAKPAQG